MQPPSYSIIRFRGLIRVSCGSKAPGGCAGARGAAQDRETWLNGRDYQWMIDPDANLAAQERSLCSAAWIVPLTGPLRGPGAGE
ncbi:MAG: hypothetical protein VX603_01845 [Gemmatimonadota bacterium]|nr:hypothetical protein [Gemmatimonadota bacterium]